MPIPTRMIRVDPRRLRLLGVNARYMPKATYDRLVANVRRDGRLTSVPFAAPAGTAEALTGPDPAAVAAGTFEVLSGNHRVTAAIDAGLAEVDCMVTDEDLPRDRRVAIQLSHNALAGEDDPATLKALYESLDVDAKGYSGLDDRTLDLLTKVQVGALGEANLEFQTLCLAFLPHELDRLKDALTLAKQAGKGSAAKWALRWAEYDRLLDALDEAGAAHGVTNQATAMMAVLDIFDRHAAELAAGWDGPDGEPAHNGKVPIASLFGHARPPAKDAQKVRRALDRMVARGECPADEPWRALVAWAEAYLAVGDRSPDPRRITAIPAVTSSS